MLGLCGERRIGEFQLNCNRSCPAGGFAMMLPRPAAAEAAAAAPPPPPPPAATAAAAVRLDAARLAGGRGRSAGCRRSAIRCRRCSGRSDRSGSGSRRRRRRSSSSTCGCPPLRVELGPHHDPLSCRPVQTSTDGRMSTDAWYARPTPVRRNGLPRRAAVPRHVHAAVVAVHHVLAVERIDPDRVVVDVAHVVRWLEPRLAAVDRLLRVRRRRGRRCSGRSDRRESG